MNNPLITYTYNNYVPYTYTCNKHLNTLTINMKLFTWVTHMSLKHVLNKTLGNNLSDDDIQAILDYPMVNNIDKDVTVLF